MINEIIVVNKSEMKIHILQKVNNNFERFKVLFRF